MRRDPEFFGDEELSLLYMARRLPEALRLEELLTAHAVEYLLETGDYTGGFLLRRELTGAYFYVAPGALAEAQELLRTNRYKPYDGA